jgi:DNA-binding NarL/FixJ family response regulator
VSEFIDALAHVAHGGTVLDPEVVRQLLGAGRRQDSLATLTPREKEVLSLIAAALFISPKVVEKHVATIFGKLGLNAAVRDESRPLWQRAGYMRCVATTARPPHRPPARHDRARPR